MKAFLELQFWEKHPFYTLLGNKGFQEKSILKWWTYIDQPEHFITVLKFWITCTVYRCKSRNEYTNCKGILYVIYSNIADSFFMLWWKKYNWFAYFVDLFIQYDESISILSKSYSIIRLECFYGSAVVKSIIIHGQSCAFPLLNTVYF